MSTEVVMWALGNRIACLLYCQQQWRLYGVCRRLVQEVGKQQEREQKREITRELSSEGHRNLLSAMEVACTNLALP